MGENIVQAYYRVYDHDLGPYPCRSNRASDLGGECLRQIVYTLRIGRWSPLTQQERAELQPPLFLAPCALAAVVIVRFSLPGFGM